MAEIYNEKIRNIACNAFEITCYMFPLDDWELEEYGNIEISGDTKRALVEFDGAVDGGLVIEASPELLNSITSNMLGVDEADEDQKEGALCEIANIICGNTVPLFAKNNEICYIRPPRILEAGEEPDSSFAKMHKESIRIYLDEGAADIFIYFSNEAVS